MTQKKLNNWTLTYYESDRKLNIEAKLYTPAHISQPFRIRIFKESRDNTINLPQEFTRLCQQVKVVCLIYVEIRIIEEGCVI